MPVTIDPNPQTSTSELRSRDYGYAYPFEKDFRPGSELHESLKRRILDRAQESWDVMSERHPDWDKVDNTMTAFIPQDKREKQVKSMDGRKPTSVVVPITYAIKETILSHLISIYTYDGLWQYEARGPEDVPGVALLENLIDAQSRWFKHLLAVHTFLQDGISKGLGVVAPVWETKYGLRDQIVQNPLTGEQIRQPEHFVEFEGNRLRNIDPRLYLPDVNVPAHEVQDGEYVGWVWRDNMLSILAEEQNSPDEIFNAKYLKHLGDGRTALFRDGKDTVTSRLNTHPIDRIYMYDRIIPAEVGLGPSEYPEIWCFQLAGDEVIISAKPLGLTHNMFPVAVCAPDFDGYGARPISRLEVTLGLQGVADFLYNSHIADVRKNQFGLHIYDPSIINTNDLVNNNPHKYIRVRRKMFGQNAIEKGYKHIPIPKSTLTHVDEVSVIDGLIAKATGASESMQGVYASAGPRKSVEEARNTHLSGMGRIEKMARIISEQGMSDLAYMMGKHTQQFMSMETYVKITGRLHQDLMRIYDLSPDEVHLPVGPQDIIDISYDAIIRDGSNPSSSFIQEHIQLMQLAAADPRVYSTYDTARWMGELAKTMGIKNFEDFRFKARMAGTGEIEEGMAEGTLQPL